MEVAPFFVDFHHFLSIFTIFYPFSRFTHFCRDLHFVAINALFPQFFFGQSSLLRNITRFLHVWAQVQLFYMQSPLRPNLYFQEIERHDPDLICLEEVNFGISRSNTSIQCPYSRWTASHSSGTIWTVWVLPGFGFQNLRRHV